MSCLGPKVNKDRKVVWALRSVTAGNCLGPKVDKDRKVVWALWSIDAKTSSNLLVVRKPSSNLWLFKVYYQSVRRESRKEELKQIERSNFVSWCADLQCHSFPKHDVP